MKSDHSKNKSEELKVHASPGATKKIVMEKIKAFCRKKDSRKSPVKRNNSNALLTEKVGMPLEFGDRLKNPKWSSMDRLKQDCRLEDLVRYVTAEIQGAKLRDHGSHYAMVSKHQYVGILKSFFKPEGSDEWLPLAESLTDLVIGI
jgi:hypothetical protein